MRGWEMSWVREKLAAAALAAVVVGAAACGGSGSGTVGQGEPLSDDFVSVTDCGELERLASAEVDRINATTDSDIIAAATAHFERIVAHRDSICN